MSSKLKTPLMLIAGVLIVLAMLRLGVWQLDRADQKHTLYLQQKAKSERASVPFGSLDVQNAQLQELRYTNTEVSGRYLSQGTIFIDNQVLNGQVGYQVFSPFLPTGSQTLLLVNRGWVPVGESRETAPSVDTPSVPLKLLGRLNNPPAQPPMWDDDYAVAQGAVWAYLPIEQYAAQFQFDVLPLVLELAPDQTFDAQLRVAWSGVKQNGAAKHQGYALQWFAMAAAFVVLCLVLLIRSRKERFDNKPK